MITGIRISMGIQDLASSAIMTTTPNHDRDEDHQ
jgi:hypothetical protein